MIPLYLSKVYANTRHQQTTFLGHDTLTTVTCYPLYQWSQIMLRSYSALSGDYDNSTTGHYCTANEVHARKSAVPGTPYQNIVWNLGIIYAQQFPHTFPRYMPRQKIRPNYLGRCKCATNWNDAIRSSFHKVWSTDVTRLRQPRGVCVHLQHQHFGSKFNKDWNNYWRRLH